MENRIEEIYDALYDYFEFDGISKKNVLYCPAKEALLQSSLWIANRDLPLSVYISHDCNWAILSVNLCMNCAQGCEQRILTYCSRIYTSSNCYVQGVFRLDSYNVLRFDISIPTDCVLASDAYLDSVIRQSTDLLDRFYAPLQKICSGNLLGREELQLVDPEVQGKEADDWSNEDPELINAVESLVEYVEDKYASDKNRLNKIGYNSFKEKVVFGFENGLVLNVWVKELNRVCMSLVLPLQKMPNTELILQNAFQKIYASYSWHQGAFCVEESGQVSLRMGLAGDDVVWRPQLMKKCLEDGIKLVQIFYPMLNCLAQGQLLPNHACETSFYELCDAANCGDDLCVWGGDTMDIPDELQHPFTEMDDEEEPEQDDDDQYILAWDKDDEESLKSIFEEEESDEEGSWDELFAELTQEDVEDEL